MPSKQAPLTPAQKAVVTRRKNAALRAEKLSQAAQKAWATRRARAKNLKKKK